MLEEDGHEIARNDSEAIMKANKNLVDNHDVLQVDVESNRLCPDNGNGPLVDVVAA